MAGARDVPDAWTTAVRRGVAAAGVVLALASAAWIVPAAWPTYAVFFAFAFAFSFVWLDSDAPTSVAHMAMATAFVYIAGFPILFFELLARLVAYPLIFAAARRGWFALPRPLRPLLHARAARLDLAAMLGLATIGSAVRVAVVQLARAAGMASLIPIVIVGELGAYAVMGTLSAVLPLPTGEYVFAAPHRLPPEDERVDVIFSAVLIVPFLVVLIVYAWLVDGLVGAAAWSFSSLAPHWLVQLLIRRRHLLDERHVALARKQADIEALTYAVSHDVKTRLGSIRQTGAYLVEEHDGELSPVVEENLRRIARLTREAHRMVTELLRMMRVVSEPEPVEVVALGDVTAQVLDVLAADIAARRVRVDVASPLPAIRGEALKLRHVVENLVGNAIRFVPPETGRVEVSATREDGAVVLAVRDNGSGIPAGYEEEIFRMFRRAPNADGDETGTGIGLAIVKRIVEGHGGAVWVESAPRAGTVFRVRLPAG